MSDQKQAATGKEIAKKEQTMAERFTQKVIAEFTSGVGDVTLTSFQKRLAQNYFIALDSALASAEEKRKSKPEAKQDKVAVTWSNINMDLLARHVVSTARIGLDPAQKNHINMVPFKNNSTGKYDIAFIPGYRGIELQANKYALTPPDAVIVELVYSTDKFRSIKKDRNNEIESFEFEVTNDFARGDLIGGFYYHIYSSNLRKNKLVVFTKADIEKRKPEYASVEFWGGEKPIWKDGKIVGHKTVAGWYDKMCWKTIYRAAYGDITIDSQKIDDDYLRLKQLEDQINDAAVAEEIRINANSQTLKVEATIVSEDVQPDDQAEPEKKENHEGEADKPDPASPKGPSF